ncbi:hypothetical protein NT6N_16520 [Oceaniferula spumae]|uniref:Ice-binding protein C-terminal domain-containing protein n=1 Tax=Oceaniferula spumae TaxID=2979115 RepID=A0AAT9FKY1_9BACT
MKKTMTTTALAASLSGCLSAATVMQLDFGSTDQSDFGAGAPIGTESGYTALEAVGLGADNAVTNNPTVTEGAATFDITGNVSAWSGNDGETDLLTGDYLFFGGGLGTSQPITFSLSGLAANTEHTFTFTLGKNETAVRGVTYSATGVSDLVLGNGGAQSGTLTLTSDGSGVITGTATATGLEGNWAALTIESVPEPSSTALLGLGGLALILLRRK